MVRKDFSKQGIDSVVVFEDFLVSQDNGWTDRFKHLGVILRFIIFSPKFIIYRKYKVSLAYETRRFWV